MSDYLQPWVLYNQEENENLLIYYYNSKNIFEVRYWNKWIIKLYFITLNKNLN